MAEARINEFPGVRMSERDRTDGSLIALARRALIHAAILGLAGSGLGVTAILSGSVTGVEIVLLLTGSLFVTGLLVTLLIFRKVKVQSVATASTAFYAIYLCAGVVISFRGTGDHLSIIIYFVWFFPLLVFNKLVNSPAVGRVLASFILIAPLAIIFCLVVLRISGRLTTISLYVAATASLSYLCFGLMLNAVSRYREAYIVERERADSLRTQSEVLESISDCFVSFDSDFRLVYLNDAACTEFGVERRGALNHTLANAIPGLFSQLMLDELHVAFGQASASMFEAQNQSLERWYEMRCFPGPGLLSVYFRNITESVLTRGKLEAAHAHLREQSDLLDKAQDAILVSDKDSRITYWNKGAERLFGWTVAEVVGRRLADIFFQTAAEVESAFSSVLQHGEWAGELSKCHKDGRTLIVEGRSTLLRGGDGNPRSILSINTDVTHRKAADARIYTLAFYDPLTGLPNRLLLRERLEKTLARADHQENMGALLIMDLDDFKVLNDSSGHDVGDLLLRGVALRLSSCVRKTDSVARYGGDEFVVMLEGLSADAGIAALEAKAIGEAIIRACRQPYLLGSFAYDGTTSIGATLFRGKQDTAGDLLKRADLAMYRAKAQGRNNMCFFDPAMETSAVNRAKLLADLKLALQNREFELHYQPQVDSDRRVTGAEALLRWNHAQRGMVPPNEFIPLAESTGLIVELGLWVLETACSQLALWAQLPEMKGLTLAVNVSIRQFLDSRFVQSVEKVIRESGANPHRLKLEITESLTIEKANDTIAKMTALKALGVGLSMDDFGTGYSSLSQLKRLPLDQLKIDQSFVRDLLNDAKDASIVSHIIALGRSLKLSVIAEGVETEEQHRLLEELGCCEYQGYLFSAALPASRFEKFVNEACRMNDKGVA